MPLLFLIYLAYIGCYPGNWLYWDLFTNGITDSLIQVSEWTQNMWQASVYSNWYAWTSSMTVAQCVSYCYTRGFLLAGLN